MDPQDQFKKRYEAYVSQRGAQMISSPAAPPPPGKKYSPNKFYVLGVIVGFLIIAPVVSYLYFANKVNNPPSKISSNNESTTVTQPTNTQVDAELKRVWGPYYDQVKNDPKYRAEAKKNLIVQHKIQNGLDSNGIQTSSIADNNPVLQQQKDEDALSAKVLSNRSIDYVFVFVNRDDPNYDADVAKITASYDLIKNKVSQGMTIQQAYDEAKTTSGFFKPIAVTNSRLIYKDTFEKSISDKIFSLSKGQTSNLIDSGGGTFILAHVNSAVNTKYATMDEWLAGEQ